MLSRRSLKFASTVILEILPSTSLVGARMASVGTTSDHSYRDQCSVFDYYFKGDPNITLTDVFYYAFFNQNPIAEGSLEI